MERSNAKAVSKRLKEAMGKRNIRAKDISKATGLSPSVLSHYLAGDFAPQHGNLTTMARFLNVNPAWLIGFDAPMDAVGIQDPLPIESKAKIVHYVDHEMNKEQLDKTLRFIEEFILDEKK
jgi:transcriptional regulator with XRE-family HTH domain